MLDSRGDFADFAADFRRRLPASIGYRARPQSALHLGDFGYQIYAEFVFILLLLLEFDIELELVLFLDDHRLVAVLVTSRSLVAVFRFGRVDSVQLDFAEIHDFRFKVDSFILGVRRFLWVCGLRVFLGSALFELDGSKLFLDFLHFFVQGEIDFGVFFRRHSQSLALVDGGFDMLQNLRVLRQLNFLINWRHQATYITLGSDSIPRLPNHNRRLTIFFLNLF